MMICRNIMERTFHPIGQGAFYTEEFRCVNFIYDCGTDTGGVNSIKKHIDDYFKKNTDCCLCSKNKLNVVFISHFHRDHVNGLEYMLSNYDIDYIFIPQYDDFDLIVNFMFSDRNLNSFIANFTINSKCAIKSISKETKVIFIKKHVSHDGSDSKKYELRELNDGDSIESGSDITLPVEGWTYTPINYNRVNDSQAFRNRLKALQISGVQEFLVAWRCKKKRASIKRAFTQLGKNQNENSMVVYSGPTNNKENYIQYSLPSDSQSSNRVGCIYFGDYETHDKAWMVISDRLKQVFKSVGVVQIPHHGSLKNYRAEINKEVDVYSIVSYGSNNRHKHPSSVTKNSIVSHRGILKEVTEKPTSKLSFIVKAL